MDAGNALARTYIFERELEPALFVKAVYNSFHIFTPQSEKAYLLRCAQDFMGSGKRSHREAEDEAEDEAEPRPSKRPSGSDRRSGAAGRESRLGTGSGRGKEAQEASPSSDDPEAADTSLETLSGDSLGTGSHGSERSTIATVSTPASSVAVQSPKMNKHARFAGLPSEQVDVEKEDMCLGEDDDDQDDGGEKAVESDEKLLQRRRQQRLERVFFHMISPVGCGHPPIETSERIREDCGSEDEEEEEVDEGPLERLKRQEREEKEFIHRIWPYACHIHATGARTCKSGSG